MTDKKTFRGRIEFKADSDQTGQFSAEFATLGVVDHDRDVTEAGAFGEQDVPIEAWNHNYGELPVGKGAIHEEGNKAIVDGMFFLDTQGGLEHYRVVKALGPLQEWSYTFEILDAAPGKFEGQDVRFLRRMDVWGVAPVQRGAGIDTRTTSIKGGAKKAIARHTTETTDAAWDGPANGARARSGESAAYYARIYAWKDPEGDPAVKATYKFIHHMVSGDGEPGAANVRACQAGIGVLNGGRGGTTIPDGDRQGVWNHLAGHLRDADLEPPALKASSARNSGSDDTGEGDEGQTQEGAPSGPKPGVVSTQIEIDLLEV